MAGLNGTITVSRSEYRPCYAGGEKALFHCWEEKRIGETIKMLALIEYEDGQVIECKPCEVRFCDNKLSEYAFDKRNEENDR